MNFWLNRKRSGDVIDVVEGTAPEAEFFAAFEFRLFGGTLIAYSGNFHFFTILHITFIPELPEFLQNH